jgi:hypothetical protein
MARRRSEWLAQIELSRLLNKWLDDSCSFATAVDAVARSAIAGKMRQLRGVRSGLPDNWVLYHGKLVTIEMKVPGGRCTPSQLATREALLRAGIHAWWMCLSARSALWALRRSGVRFRKIVNADGTVERWRKAKLAPWEVPRRDPSEPRPQHPEVVLQRRAAQRRWRERRRAAREAALATQQYQVENIDTAYVKLPDNDTASANPGRGSTTV